MRSAGTVGHGFLKHSFRPVTGFNIKNRHEAEDEFFRSVHNLCEFYKIDKPDISGLTYPDKISGVHAALNRKLEAAHGISCYIMQDSKRMSSLATVMRYDTGHNLYYIPVHALTRIGEHADLKPLYVLLEYICNYLYKVSGVEFYRDTYTYIRSVYDTLEDWMRNDNDGECYDELLSEMVEMNDFGDNFSRRLKLPFSRTGFEKCIAQLRQSGCCAVRPLEMAMEFAKLMADYPKRSVYSSIPKDFYTWHENGTIEIGHYLGFYWGGSEKLNEQFFDYVDNDLQERGEQVEPLALQWFDSPQEQQKFNFDYEARLFPLLIELNNFLYQYDHVDKHHQ